MALIMTIADRFAGGLPALPRLLVLSGAGAAVYLGWLTTFARPRLAELLDMLRSRGRS